MIGRRVLVLLGLLGLALVVTVVWATAQTRDDSHLHALDTHSAGRAGGRVLYEWLGDLGYPVRQLEFAPWELPASTRVLFVLAPTEPFDRDQLARLNRWLEDGGTLVLAVRSSTGNPLGFLRGGGDVILRELGLGVALRQEVQPLAPVQPLARPPVTAFGAGAGWYIQPIRARRDASEPVDPAFPRALPMVTVVGPSDGALLGVVPVGTGRIWLIADGEWLGNARLGEAQHAEVVLNFLAGLPPGPTSVIWFDEWHHGYATSTDSLPDQLTQSAWGRSLIAAALLIWLYLWLSGRRFGRPVPVEAQDPQARRSTGELVTSLAHLLHTADKRDWALRTTLDQTLQRLAAWLGVRTGEHGRALVERLAATGRLPGDGPAALRALVERAERGGVSDRELVEAARALANLERRVREGAG